MANESSKTVNLPEPEGKRVSVEKALRERRSVRSFKDEALSLAEISQLLWSAQGITSPRGFRAAPSAGALYPLEIYLVAGNVENLADGVYRYVPEKHELEKIAGGDKRTELYKSALGQRAVLDAPAGFVISAVYNRTTRKYGERGIRYVHMEAGHAAQNLCLQAISLDLATVVIGAFTDRDVKEILSVKKGEEPLYIIPAGVPQK